MEFNILRNLNLTENRKLLKSEIKNEKFYVRTRF